MRKLCLTLCLIFLSFCALAQEVGLSLDNAAYIDIGQTISVDAGTPVIFTNRTASEEKFEPQEVRWKPELKKVAIKTFGNSNLEVPFVTHIPSFWIFVQVLPDKSVVVTERIAFVNETPVGDFSRTYPLFIKGSEGQAILPKRDFLYATYNGKNVVPLLSETPDSEKLTFFANEGLSSGVHLFEITYTVPEAVVTQGNISRLLLSLLGTDTPYLTERLQVLVSYPTTAKVQQAKALYGANNQIFEKAGDFYQDQDGHLIYKQNGILPAQVDLKIELLGDSVAFMPVSAAEKLDNHLNTYAWFWVALFGGFILFLYLFFSADDLRDQFVSEKFLTKVRSKIKYDSVLLRPLILNKMDARAFLVAVLQLFEKKALQISFSNEDEIVLSKGTCKTLSSERRLMRLIFPIFKKKRLITAKQWRSGMVKKFKVYIALKIKKQNFVLMQREFLISALLFVVSLLFVGYFGATVLQFILAVAILLFFWIYAVDLFKRRAHLNQELTALFKAYVQTKKTAERQLLCDVALDLGERSCDRTIAAEFHSKRIPLGIFEKMFLRQLTITKGDKK